MKALFPIGFGASGMHDEQARLLAGFLLDARSKDRVFTKIFRE